MANRGKSSFSDRLGGAPHSKQSLRLWLKLLSCTMVVEKRLRARLDADFDTTLPRFDVLAALERHPQGLKMSALSEFLMVSNGNVTGVVSRLIEDGLITRTVDRADRRSATRAAHAQGPRCVLEDGGRNERWMECDVLGSLRRRRPRSSCASRPVCAAPSRRIRSESAPAAVRASSSSAESNSRPSSSASAAERSRRTCAASSGAGGCHAR